MTLEEIKEKAVRDYLNMAARGADLPAAYEPWLRLTLDTVAEAAAQQCRLKHWEYEDQGRRKGQQEERARLDDALKHAASLLPIDEWTAGYHGALEDIRARLLQGPEVVEPECKHCQQQIKNDGDYCGCPPGYGRRAPKKPPETIYMGSMPPPGPYFPKPVEPDTEQEIFYNGKKVVFQKEPYNQRDHEHCPDTNSPCGLKGKHRCCLCTKEPPVEKCCEACRCDCGKRYDYSHCRMDDKGESCPCHSGTTVEKCCERCRRGFLGKYRGCDNASCPCHTETTDTKI